MLSEGESQAALRAQPVSGGVTRFQAALLQGRPIWPGRRMVRLGTSSLTRRRRLEQVGIGELIIV